MSSVAKMKSKHEKLSKEVFSLKKKIADVDIVQNDKAEQVAKTKDILRRPLTVVTVFEPVARAKKDDEIDGCNLKQSQTDSSFSTKRSKNKYENGQDTENQMQRKSTRNYELRATSATQKNDEVKMEQGPLSDRLFDSKNATDDKDYLVALEIEQQRASNKVDLTASCGDFTLDENNSDSELLEKEQKIFILNKKVGPLIFVLVDTC